MMEVAFTQYLRPDGRRKRITIDRPDAIAAQAIEIQKRGGVFEIEVLTTGHVSMTIEPRDEKELETNGPWAHEIVANGPDVSLAVDRLILAAYGKASKEGGE